MLQTLTAYLLQTNKLYIPHVGTFRVDHQPAVLHFADRLLYPPQSNIFFKAVTDAQKNDTVLFVGENFSEEALSDFGQKLINGLAAGPFIWPGVGTLELRDDRVFYQPESSLGFLPVPANKVLRENRQHAILVGDQEHSSADISFMGKGVAGKKRTWLWVGWLLLLIALFLIGWIIFKEGALFGSKIKAFTTVQGTLTQSFYS